MTSKQRAKLRGLASKIDTIFQIGKAGITEQLVRQVDDALTARELIKLRVLETSPVFAAQAAQQLAEQTNAQVVQIIGSKLVLYRPNPKKPVITLD